jgi:hypothetical protein
MTDRRRARRAFGRRPSEKRGNMLILAEIRKALDDIDRKLPGRIRAQREARMS